MKKIAWVLLVSTLVVSCGESDKGEDKDKENDLPSSNIEGEDKVETESTEVTAKSAEVYLNELDGLSKRINDQSVVEIYKKTLELHQSHPGDSASARALFKSANALNNHAIADVSEPDGVVKRGVSLKALDLVNLLIDEYPDFKMRKQAYDLKVGILDGNLRMKKESIELFEMLLKKYPDDSMSVDYYQDRIENIDTDPYAFLKAL